MRVKIIGSADEIAHLVRMVGSSRTVRTVKAGPVVRRTRRERPRGEYHKIMHYELTTMPKPAEETHA